MIAVVRCTFDMRAGPARVDCQPRVGGRAHGDSWAVQDGPQWMVNWSTRDEKGHRRGIWDGNAKITDHGRHCGAGRQDDSISPNRLPIFGCHTGYGAGMGSDGALSHIGDQPPAAFQEVRDQELDEAGQINPSLARIPHGTGVRDGRHIDARSVSADLLAREQLAVVAMSHQMIMASVQLLSFRVPGEPAREAQPAQARLLGRQSAVAVDASHPEPMVGLCVHAS